MTRIIGGVVERRKVKVVKPPQAPFILSLLY